MRLKGRRWIYMLIIMGLLVKFLITGVIVVLTTRRGPTNEKGSGNVSVPPVSNRHINVSEAGSIVFSYGPETHAGGEEILHSR